MPASFSRASRPKIRKPKLRHFKPGNKGFIEWQGRRIYLAGKFQSPDCMADYRMALKELRQHGRLVTIGDGRITVAQIVAAFMDHAESYYLAADRRISSEVYTFRSAIQPLIELYAGLPAEELSPLKLEEVRTLMIAKGWNRSNINKQVSRLRVIFKWAVSRELISENILIRLQTIQPLKPGRSAAPEPTKVHSISPVFVRSIYPQVAPQIEAILELLIQTGARAGEIITMRSCDITVEKDIWWYTPSKHKTQHHGCERFIPLNERAREIIQPFLAGRPVGAFLFSPAEADHQLREKRRAKRVTPFSGGSPAPSLQPLGQGDRKFHDRYDVAGLGMAVRRACDAAFPPPPHLARVRGETTKAWRERLDESQREELATWHKDHRFHVHQIRHTVLTEVAKQHGVESTRALGGHQHLRTTAIYLERDRNAASKAVAGLW